MEAMVKVDDRPRQLVIRSRAHEDDGRWWYFALPALC
jgi:hypothetical protein